MDKARKASVASARRAGNGGLGDEVQAGKGKLSQVYGVRKKSITPAQFRESLRKEAAEKTAKLADRRKQEVVDKAKELWRRDSPKKKEVLRERLPPNFLLLERYFEGLEAASSLLRTRRKICTFSAVAKTVENMTGRRFTMKHLAQIKYIFPEVLGLELLTRTDPDTSKKIRDLKVALLPVCGDSMMGAAAADGDQVKERYKTKEVSRKEEFRAKLLAHFKAHPEAEEIPEADVPQHHTFAEPAGDSPTDSCRAETMKNQSSFLLRPCDAPKSQAGAAESSSPCPSVPHGSAIPGTPFQPSPFVGYSQLFVENQSASTPLEPSSSQVRVKPSFSAPVRPQTAARELRFGTPVAATKTGMESGSGSTEDLHTDPGPSKLVDADCTACTEKRETAVGSVTPTRSARESNLAESPYKVDGFSMPPGSPFANDMGRSSATPSCSTPLRPQEWTPEQAGPLMQSALSPPNVLPYQLQTPKRSRVNLGLIFDQDLEAQGCSKPFMSPSKKLHAAGVEQEQVQHRRLGLAFEQDPKGQGSSSKPFVSPSKKVHASEVEQEQVQHGRLGLCLDQDPKGQGCSNPFMSPSKKLQVEHEQVQHSRIVLGLELETEGPGYSTPYMSPSKKLHAAVLQQEQVLQRRDVPMPGHSVEGENVQHESSSKPKAGGASFDPEIVKCLPTRLVQSVREKERRALEEKSRGVAEQRKLAQMKADLPKLFSTVRQIFQDRSVLPHQLLISKVLSSNGGMTNSLEVEERLKLLLSLASDWISVKISSTGDRLYRISKTADVVGVRKRIAGSV